MPESNTSLAFFNAINESSKELKSEMIHETDLYRLAETEKTRAEAQKKYEDTVASAVARMAAQDNIESESLYLSLKKNVTKARSDIADSVFCDVENKIKQFVLSDEYVDFLLSSAEAMVKKCARHQLTVFMHSRDLKYAEKIKALSDDIIIKTDDSIKLGGIYCICREKQFKLNDLLETRLNELKEHFYEISELVV